MTTALPKLPTSVVGSHGLPGWVWLAREAMDQDRLGQSDLRELMEDATLVALADQERAGVDVVSTGEMMRVRFIIGFYDHITGIKTLPAPRKPGQPLWDTNTPFVITVSSPKRSRRFTTRRSCWSSPTGGGRISPSSRRGHATRSWAPGSST